MTLPKKFGHYKVDSEIGRGGMAVVYKCWEEALNRFVAIKVLSSHLAQDKDIKKRFFREAKSMAAISHPNIINVHYIGEEKGQPFFVMEYINGKSLSELFSNNRVLHIEHAKNILYQSCEGLLAAHDSGLIHRDIKPGNLMIANNGFVKLLDFGIAQSTKFNTNLTKTDEIVGTPGYLSPEICVGENVDKRSDIYSLGIVFYQMLAGDVPFDTSTPYKLLKDIVESNISNIQNFNKKIDKKSTNILSKMISKNPEDRYQNCQEILDALGKVDNKSSISTIIKQSTKNLANSTNHQSSDKPTIVNLSKNTGLLKKALTKSINTIILKKYTFTFIVLLVLTLGYLLINNKGTQTNTLPISSFVPKGTQTNTLPTSSFVAKDTETDNLSTSGFETKNESNNKTDKVIETFGQNIDENDLEMNGPVSEPEVDNQNDDMGEFIKTLKIPEASIPSTPNTCLEIGPVSVSKIKNNIWPFKKAPEPPVKLLKDIRKQVVYLIRKDKLINNYFSKVKFKCLANEKSYQLSMKVVAYKKTSKAKKYISIVGLGSEKTNIVLTLINLNTKRKLAQREIETKEISNQLKSSNINLDFIKSVKLFLNVAID